MRSNINRNKNHSFLKKIHVVHPEYKNNRFVLNVPSLKYSELPFVSVITITRNRLHLFDLANYNWKKFKYPKDKIEWIIVDDSDSKDHQNNIIKDNNVHFYNISRIKDFGDKRNFAVSKAKGEIIVNMDDDDHHYPDSILAKVQLLKHYKKRCLFSIPIGVYNVLNNTSQIIGLQNLTKNKQIPEATMAFRKSFWEKQKFKMCKQFGGEGYNMIHKRFKHVSIMPFWFNCICFTHKNNVTGALRNIKSRTNNANFYDFFDEELKGIVNDIKNKSIK